MTEVWEEVKKIEDLSRLKRTLEDEVEQGKKIKFYSDLVDLEGYFRIEQLEEIIYVMKNKHKII